MTEKYGVQMHYAYGSSSMKVAEDLGNRIIWYDTLEEAIDKANGQPIIKSVAYEVKEATPENEE